MHSLSIILILFLTVYGCNKESASVKINTAGIFNPVLYSIDDVEASGKTIDRGEHILTDDPVPLTVRVYNKTKFPYTDLDLVLGTDDGADNAPAIAFVPTETGEIVFPGKDGTCGRTLPANSTCLIKLLYSPREGRRYVETITLNFKNYVDPEQHTAKLLFLAGMPASLTFTNDITQYTFGRLVGTAKLPVVERTELTTYSEELEILNAGELSAKSLTINLLESCSSALTNLCPGGMAGAYTVENNCPGLLMPGEKCKVKINYLPKNQDPNSGPIPDDIKEINYRATVTFGYIKDPTGATAALNGYFRSISTNIEAKFKVALTNLTFETPIISGNREIRAFRVNNLGYREGEIQAIAVRDSGGSLITTCRASITSEYLDCVDVLNFPISLANFPFRIKDRSSCLTLPPEEKKYIDVGSGCIFDFVFQPSVTYLTNKITDFLNLQPEVIFDSRWKANEKIVTSKLFNLSATSLAAARMELDTLRLDGVNFPSTGTNPWLVDLKRLTLQSPGFFKRKPMIITFKNNGSVNATNLNFKDANGRNIPIGGSGTSLGAYLTHYYSSVIASDSTCTIVAPGESCSITLMFAPIGRDLNSEEDANMFDATGGDGKRYKGFKLTYDSGSSFTDANIDGDSDILPSMSEARVQAQLIRKGMLMEFTDDTRNVSGIGGNVNVTGDTSISHIYLQNIGTGSVPYIRLMNPPTPNAPSLNPNVTLIPTGDPASLGADYDCLDLVDEDYTYTVASNQTPDNRMGNFSGLPKDKSCVYTMSMKTTDKRRHFNSVSCINTLPTETNAEEASRLFSRDLSGVDMWEYCSVLNIPWPNISVHYFDGDATDPALPPGSNYGKRIALNNYTYQAIQHSPAKLILNNFVPFLTATLYRPEIAYPTISSGQLAQTITEKWFYGTGTNFYYQLNDPLQTSPFIQGDDSRDFVPTLGAFGDKGNYDYILYLGSFPQGSPNVIFPIGIKNVGGIVAKVNSIFITPNDGFSVVTQPLAMPLNLPMTSEITPLTFQLNTSVFGEHRMELEYEYENGRHLTPLIYNSRTVASNIGTSGREALTQKILVVANVRENGTYPFLTMSAEDYEVVQNEGAPPTETIQPAYPIPLSWNTTTAASTLVFDTIKLTAAAKPTDVYAKKRIKFTNTTAYPLTELRSVYRADATNSLSKAPPSTFTTVTAGSTCTANMTLAPGASCYLVLRYQPNTSDTSENYTLSMVYKMGPGQFVMQNLGIGLLPRSPGQLLAFGKITEPINYKISPTSSIATRSSYPLNIGTSNLDVVPKVFAFKDPSSTWQKLRFVNSQTTKASLLLSYQKYLAAHSLRGFIPSSFVPTSTVPLAGEYTTHTDGLDYTIIHKVKYGDGSDRLLIQASKGCLFGDDELTGSIPAHQKGFNSVTVTPCYAVVTFSANFEYLRKTISVTNGDDMRGSAAELWYYSVNRSSTASLWIHVKGVIQPNTTLASGSYSNITAFENKTSSIGLPVLNSNNPLLGDIVGMRVLRSTTFTGLGDPYSTAHTSYVDIRPYDPGIIQYANFTTGMVNGTYYYYKVVAIRKDARFIDTVPKRFLNLRTNEYLSLVSNLTNSVKVLTPPINHHYFHNQKLLVEKSLHTAVAYDPYLTASNKCALRTKLTLKDPGNVVLPYQLIRLTTWNLLLSTPAATNYSNMTQISHWLGDASVSINSKCSGLSGFISNTSSQMLDSSGVFYIRDGVNPNANVYTAIGGIPGTTKANYTSYIDGVVGYGSSRCMISLP